MMTPQFPIVLHSDQEHTGLRVTVLVILFAGLILFYWLVSALLQAYAPQSVLDYLVAVSCVSAIVLALAVSWGVEQWLKRVWHSGRRLTLDQNGLIAIPNVAKEQEFHWDKRFTILGWHFKLGSFKRGGRERRLRNNWICVACQVQQDDQRIIVHSYMPPRKAAVWAEKDLFHEIHPEDVYEKSVMGRMGAPARPQITNEVLTGQDGRYWLAERRRWDEGFELTAEDFAIFMQTIQKKQRESGFNQQLTANG